MMLIIDIQKEYWKTLIIKDINRLFTDINMLLMVEKGIRVWLCHAIQRYAKANNMYMKNHDENNESW